MQEAKKTVVSNNPIWSPERAQGKIVFASLAELLVLRHSDDARINLVWPDEGEFLAFGNKGTFRVGDGMMINGFPLTPLIMTKDDAAKVMRLYDEANSPAMKQKLEGMVRKSRAAFAKVFDAAVLYCTNNPLDKR